MAVSAHILVAAEAPVTVVTLNRPEKRNAVRLAMWRELETVFLDLRGRSDIRAVILTGAGGNFCAGADISEFPAVRSTVEAGRVYEEASEAATIAIRDFPRPTIAAVSGFGVGGGCGLALACDFRVADATTRMGIPAARLGIIYSTLDCKLLYRQVGLTGAKRVLFSGRFFGVEDCLRMGLADIVADGSALDGARALAADFADSAPLTLQGSKTVLEAIDRGDAEAREGEIQTLIDQALESRDYREGGRAFLEKRKPVFLGR